MRKPPLRLPEHCGSVTRAWRGGCGGEGSVGSPGLVLEGGQVGDGRGAGHDELRKL